jgi:hypothetical protein
LEPRYGGRTSLPWEGAYARPGLMRESVTESHCAPYGGAVGTEVEVRVSDDRDILPHNGKHFVGGDGPHHAIFDGALWRAVERNTEDAALHRIGDIAGCLA